MQRSAVQIYALAVCFASLMCLVVALGIGLFDVVQIGVPQFTMAGAEVYGSNEQYRLYYPDKKDLPEQQISELRQQALHLAVVAERRAAQQSAVFVLIVLAIDAVVFLVHSRIARQIERASSTINNVLTKQARA